MLTRLVRTPDESLCDCATERRVHPVWLCVSIDRHHVNVTDEQGRLQRWVAAWPSEEGGVVAQAQPLNLELRPHLGLVCACGQSNSA